MRLEAVGKRYGPRQPWVVRDVTQPLGAGRLVKVEVPNGSGKSTLLRVLAGVTAPSAGRVTGRPPTGYVPERFPGRLGFSAREYLTHMSRIHSLTGTAVQAAADEWLERLGAADYAGSPLSTLSKGMCQKVAIAQALVARPELLVLDEAWTGLDVVARQTLDAAVAERLSAGALVVFVDHDPVRLAGLVDERWILASGAVTVAPGSGAAAAGGAGAADSGAAERVAAETPDDVIVIEVSGLEPGSVARITTMPGVLTAQLDAAESVDGRVRVTARVPQSDDVLRQLLSLDDVHVRALRAGSEAAT